MECTEKQPLIIISGPTAVGKTAVSVELAKHIGGEIISADSMQVYKRMNIGTAKITPEEMQDVPHHLIDILEPDEAFGVFNFKELAKAKIDEILSRGHLPIVVGGTGFYIQALLYDIDFSEYNDDEQSEIRKSLEDKLEKCGSLYMHEYLKSIDPRSAKTIHQNDTKRLLHAIEFYELTGKRISEHNEEQSVKESPYDFRYFVLTDDREKIYERINKRVDIMMEEGLTDEVKALLEEGISHEAQSMLGIGYKEIADYLIGRVALSEAVENIKRETRHFAKRQLTWYKRERAVELIDRREYLTNDDIINKLLSELKEFNKKK